MDVKRQQGGADQGDLFDEALKAALRQACPCGGGGRNRERRNRTWGSRGAASAHGMGP
jgi:hypothetical protein